MRNIFLCIIFLIPLLSNAQYRCQDVKNQRSISSQAPSLNYNAKSDSIDILHTSLELDMTNIAAKQMSAQASILIRSKLNNVSSIGLDLLKLQIDSISDKAGSPLSYSYNDTVLRVQLNSLSIGDSSTLNIFYHGQPKGDASGWGGFHYSNGYYFNLGVGFAANPHTYGRSWYPCFDNFVEHSTYSFKVESSSNHRVLCNGLLKSVDTLSNQNLVWTYEMGSPIPSYLVSVALSTYEVLSDTIQAKNAILPIELFAKAADTSNLKSSFRNLKPSFHSLENSFGEYSWEKLGYAMTTTGAMEHSTSIHYPINLANGSLGGEDIMVHELAHHWFGNKITCETDLDMWINEGMAEYCSHLYREDLYGRTDYLNTVAGNAYIVLRTAHLNDDGYKAIQGLDHAYVYGTHVYQKGAMVGHNLRAYMGDSLFFSSLSLLLEQNKYQNLSTQSFKDGLENISGLNLSDFFDQWVLNPGFSQVSIDSIVSGPNSNNNLFSSHITIGKRSWQSPNGFTNLPVDISFFSAQGDTTNRTVKLSQDKENFTFNDLDFEPVFALANYSRRILGSSTYDHYKIKANQFPLRRYADIRLSINSIVDSAELIAVHHFGNPKGKIPAWADFNTGDRYWTIRGINTQNLSFGGRIDYNANANGFDQRLCATSEDSLVILFREDATKDWELYKNQQKVDIGSNTNGIGYFLLDTMITGEYTLANSGQTISIIEEEIKEEPSIQVYPNPNNGKLKLLLNYSEKGSYPLEIYDLSGKLVHDTILNHQGNKETYEINLGNLKGQFFLQVLDQSKWIFVY